MSFSCLPKEKERGSKGRAIYRAVGGQVTYTTLYGLRRIRSTRNVIYNFYLYRHWRHLQKGKKVKRSIKEKYIGQQVLRAVITDILSIINIINIADVANIVIDITDITIDKSVTKVSHDKA